MVYFHPFLGKISNLTSIFFKWVETTKPVVVWRCFSHSSGESPVPTKWSRLVLRVACQHHRVGGAPQGCGRFFDSSVLVGWEKLCWENCIQIDAYIYIFTWHMYTCFKRLRTRRRFWWYCLPCLPFKSGSKLWWKVFSRWVGFNQSHLKFEPWRV